MGQSPLCYTPSFVEIGPPVPEKKIFMVLTNMCMAAIFGHVTRTIYIHFISLFLRMLRMKFGFDWPSGFRGEDLLNCGRPTDGRTPEHGHPISSPFEPSAQVS